MLQQFGNMKSLPIFEINWKDYSNLEEDDYEIFYVHSSDEGIWVNGYGMVEWDDCFSLDEHLSKLFDNIIEEGKKC